MMDGALSTQIQDRKCEGHDTYISAHIRLSIYSFYGVSDIELQII